MKYQCPDCGAGIVSESDQGIVFQLPRDYPFEIPCEACAKRDAEMMYAAGQKFAEQREATIMNAILGNTPQRD